MSIPTFENHFPGAFVGYTASHGQSAAADMTLFNILTPFTTGHKGLTAVNATATLTVAQVAAGYITCTSTSAVTMTMPTGTLLGAALQAVQGTTFELYIDNTASTSSGVVTMAVAVNGVKSDAANTTAASFGQMTVAVGVSGLARFTLMFSSPTAYAFTRTA